MPTLRLLLRFIALPMLILVSDRPGLTQDAPASLEHVWRYFAGQQPWDLGGLPKSTFFLDAGRTYSLPELIDLAEAHNPETRAAWELARAGAAAWGVARSELFPTLTVLAISQTVRREAFFGSQFTPQTIQAFDATLALSYTVFDFGARAGRIDAAKAHALGTNLAFNDAHRRVILSVERAYFDLLNAQGQEDAARASLANSKAVQQAAEDRLKQGLATLPDVLEARSATARADFDLQTTLGAERLAHGNLATAIGVSPTTEIHAEPLSAFQIPESLDQTVQQAIDRGFRQRPDLLEDLADIQAGDAKVKQARAQFYPSLTVSATPTTQSVFGFQQGYHTGHVSDLAGQVNLTLGWTAFDGGARKSGLAEAEAAVHATQARAEALHDRIANEIWAAYANFETAIGQRRAAAAFLEAASESYTAAIQSYDYGVRTLLDVTNAQLVLAQARLADVVARTQVLTTLSDLAYAAGDSIQPGGQRGGQSGTGGQRR
jgi:outer membrane protein